MDKVKYPIIIDIDGVLTRETEGHKYESRKPNYAEIPLLDHLTQEGHKFVLLTSRFTEDSEVTKEWLKKHSIPYEKVLYNKPRGIAYVDDLSTPDIKSLTFLKLQTALPYCFTGTPLVSGYCHDMIYGDGIKLLSKITFLRIINHCCVKAKPCNDFDFLTEGFVDLSVMRNMKMIVKHCPNIRKG